ncbi:hypothetical protein NC653_028850 [Populus alba x Populus x berolinensis]|uniref:Uncharacterized protein n=1 Tax=Populus alba x Populus x berolinensis TaxID=444605 RepID=A0AAD6Q2T5_9ROSI|nr:hypothetical protein NC653_028850 [Populus alba x Populus x berolinensis]
MRFLEFPNIVVFFVKLAIHEVLGRLNCWFLELSIFNEKKVVHKTITHHAQQSQPNSLLNRYRRSDFRSVPTPSPLHVDEGGLSRHYPVFLPSVAFTFVFAGLPPLVELLAAWAWTYGCVGCRDRLSLPLDRFFVDGYAVVSTFISNWFHGRDFQEPEVYSTEIADLLIMAWTILDRNTRLLQAIYILCFFFLFPREKIANKIFGRCCWGIHYFSLLSGFMLTDCAIKHAMQ